MYRIRHSIIEYDNIWAALVNANSIKYDNQMPSAIPISASTEIAWADTARQLVKAELKRSNVTYEELATRLAGVGMSETKASIANKLARGAFPATFLLATLKVIGCQRISLDDL